MPEGAQTRLLHDILRILFIAKQPAREVICRREVWQHHPLKPPRSVLSRKCVRPVTLTFTGLIHSRRRRTRLYSRPTKYFIFAVGRE
jgi:hypothetical protein